MRTVLRISALAATLVVAGCTDDLPMAAPTVSGDGATAADAWGPETPPFNLEVVLRGDGFGLVKFRQPNDGAAVIYLDTWLRDMTPGAELALERAVDLVVDDVCTSTAWLRLGRGLQPQSLVADAGGTAREALFRDVSAFAPGSGFDIHFRVVNVQTQAVVLESDCYQFRISL